MLHQANQGHRLCPMCRGMGMRWYGAFERRFAPWVQPHKGLGTCDNCGGKGEVPL